MSKKFSQEELRRRWQKLVDDSKVTEFKPKRLFVAALYVLNEDIRDEDLNDAQSKPDDYMLRANLAGRILLDNGFYSLAEELYRQLLEKVDEFIMETGEHRHKGAFYANVATSCFFQGNVDKAIVFLLRAAEEDTNTFGVDWDDSFAIKTLLEDSFVSPVVDEALKFIIIVNPQSTKQEVHNLLNSFSSLDRKWAFLAYTHLAMTHLGPASTFHVNEFSRLQIFSALRSLTSLMEVYFKDLGGIQSEKTLFPTLEQLFQGKHWWNNFDRNRIGVGATRKSNVPVETQITNALSITPSDKISRYWKSLIIAYIIRNYTTHQLNLSGSLIQSHADTCFAHVLHVMIEADHIHNLP